MSWKIAAAIGQRCACGRSRIYQGAALIALAGLFAPVTSCAPSGDFFVLRVSQTFDGDAANVRGGGEITAGDSADKKSGGIIEPEGRNAGAVHEKTAVQLPPSSPEIGVKSKVSDPLAEVKRQLAQLMRTASTGELRDGPLSKAVAEIREGYFVQIGSHQVLSAAEGQMGGARIALSSMISNFDLQVRPANLPTQGVFFRVQIGPLPSQGAALDLCRSLRAKKQECFTVAESAASKVQASGQIAMLGGWASIGPGEGRTSAPTAAELAVEFATSSKSSNRPQMADAAPDYTAPGLPGLPD